MPTGWLAPVVSVIVGTPLDEIVTADPLHAVVGKHFTFAATRLLNENVVAEGEAIFEKVPGKVIIIFPVFGIILFGVKEIVCIAVIGVTSISAPAPAKVVTEFVKNTFRRSAD